MNYASHLVGTAFREDDGEIHSSFTKSNRFVRFGEEEDGSGYGAGARKRSRGMQRASSDDGGGMEQARSDDVGRDALIPPLPRIRRGATAPSACTAGGSLSLADARQLPQGGSHAPLRLPLGGSCQPQG